MDVKRIGSVLMVGLVLLSAVVVSMGTAAALERYPIKFEGYLTDENGNALHPANVQITRGSYTWIADTNSDGYYVTPAIQYLGSGSKAGIYDMYIDGEHVQTRDIKEDEFLCADPDCCSWICQWNRYGYVIPEFSTIAIPIASILGLLFFFNRRKHRKG